MVWDLTVSINNGFFLGNVQGNEDPEAYGHDAGRFGSEHPRNCECYECGDAFSFEMGELQLEHVAPAVDYAAGWVDEEEVTYQVIDTSEAEGEAIPEKSPPKVTRKQRIAKAERKIRLHQRAINSYEEEIASYKEMISEDWRQRVLRYDAEGYNPGHVFLTGEDRRELDSWIEISMNEIQRTYGYIEWRFLEIERLKRPIRGLAGGKPDSDEWDMQDRAEGISFWERVEARQSANDYRADRSGFRAMRGRFRNCKVSRSQRAAYMVRLKGLEMFRRHQKFVQPEEKILPKGELMFRSVRDAKLAIRKARQQVADVNLIRGFSGDLVSNFLLNDEITERHRRLDILGRIAGTYGYAEEDWAYECAREVEEIGIDCRDLSDEDDHLEVVSIIANDGWRGADEDIFEDEDYFPDFCHHYVFEGLGYYDEDEMEAEALEEELAWLDEMHRLDEEQRLNEIDALDESADRHAVKSRARWLRQPFVA